MKLSEFLATLFSPRRRFAFRQIEAQLRRAEVERDDYRQKWIDSLNYIQVISRQPTFEMVKNRPKSNVEPLKRRTRAEIEAEKRQQDDAEFAEFRRMEKTAPNDLPDKIS